MTTYDYYALSSHLGMVQIRCFRELSAEELEQCQVGFHRLGEEPTPAEHMESVREILGDALSSVAWGRNALCPEATS